MRYIQELPEHAISKTSGIYNYVSTTKCANCPKLSKDEWRKIRGTDHSTVFEEFRIASRNDLQLFPKRYSKIGLKEIEEKLS